MADGYNLAQMGTLSADEFAQQQQLNRQQQMAALLMQQGQRQPQGQMVSGRFVPTSFFQNITPLVQTALGSYMGNKADTEAAKLAQTIRQNKGDVEQQIINKMIPTPATSEELAGPAYQGVAPSIQYAEKPADYANALKMIQTNPYGVGKEYVPTILKQLSPEPTPEERRFKAAVADGSWKPEKQGGLNSFLNQMSDKDKASLILDKQRLGLESARLGIAQQQLAFDTGMGMGGGQGGQPMAGGQGGANNKFAPANIEQYQYNPNLTGKQNQEQAGKFYENQSKNVTNAKESFDLMKSAGSILASNAPSSGLISNALTTAGEALNLPFGARKSESGADSRLKMLSGALTMKQPRFEGPQGVLDVTLYQKLAGDLGNANIPVESRLETMKDMVNLQKKYYPNGDWDSIKTQLDNAKVTLGAPKEVDFNSLPTGNR
jgi:hypothetical protein